MRKSLVLGLVPIVVISLVNCASHKPMGAHFRSAEDMTTQESVDGDVWASDGLSGSEFDRIYDWKFSNRGYSAAIIAVRNNSENAVQFSWQDIEGIVHLLFCKSDLSRLK